MANGSTFTGDTTRRIHFLDGVQDHGAAYECLRCGHVTMTKVEMLEHREGLISACDWSRFKEWVRSLRTAIDRNGGDS